ncbi:MAG: ABC transporter ATP-binding protein [Gammaproteobacteria bacterium]|nr:ABC transporter ATP-binding protein [Gammaproteobacteria bacterium]MDH3447820.1 ABC transporter ATP-binding protein [Gammaproteobacteria bacterium]
MKLLLELKNTAVNYGKVEAARDISIKVPEGDVITLIGANGAGKSTTLRMISGLVRPTAGEVLFEGNSIAELPPEEITGIGIAHVPEGRRVFPQMSVKENLEMGAYLRNDSKELANNFEIVFSHFPRLKERINQAAGTMSGGEQQMVAMGRALMSSPRLILMDEPSLGLSPIMCQEIARIIKEIHAHGRTIILVEQNARLALALADYGYVLETGNIALEGRADQLKEDDNVRQTYLGI